jgi:hypothetical protein
VAIPTESATAADFEGVTTNNLTTEYDTEGNLAIRNGASVGVMRYGRIYGRLTEDADPAYASSVYLVTSGDEAGRFTSTSGSNTVAISARFLSRADKSANIAIIELFNQAQA